MHLIVSYVPLAMGIAGETLEMTKGVPEKLTEWLSSHPTGNAFGVLWMLDDDVPMPVLILERAQEIFEHLVAWTEESPSRWFDLAITVSRDRYALVLFPRLEKSVKRFEMAYEIRNGRKPDSSQYQIVFHPLFFISNPGATAFSALRDRIGKTCKVGFLDKADVSDDPSKTDFSKISHVGPFDVKTEPGFPGVQYLEDLLKKEEEDGED
jgi:hypothetical protein